MNNSSRVTLAMVLVAGILMGPVADQTVAQESGGAAQAPAATSDPATSDPATPSTNDAASADAAGTDADSSDAAGSDADSSDEGPVQPWDYLPYRVLVWIVSDDPMVNAASIDDPLRTYLDRDFAAIWRMDIADAPTSVRSAAMRDIAGLTYDSILASDPVIAVKRNHPEAVRIRVAMNVGMIVQKVMGTKTRIAEVKRRGAAIGNESLDGVAERLEAIDGDERAVPALWAEESTEAVIVSRGLALTLAEPTTAKLITPPIAGLVGQAVEAYDKIFIVRIDSRLSPQEVSVVEMDTLMRHFGPVAREWSFDSQQSFVAIGRGVTRAFAPVVRIDNAGQQDATGPVRAAGLIIDKDSPAAVRINDVLEPMARKNDRNGKPILIGPIDWAFLHVTEPEIAALCAGSPFQVGDQVLSIGGRRIDNPQRVEDLLREHRAGEPLTVEVQRGDQTTELKIDWQASDPPPLQLQYFGFTAGVRRGQVIVKRFLPESPGEGTLETADKILTVGKSKVTSILELNRLVVSAKAGQPIEFSVDRDDQKQSVEVIPTTDSARMRRDDTSVVMDYYAGRAGGLQGRKNKRTFRRALKVRPFGDQTMIRLHAKGDADFPLIGYEIYQKELSSKDMTFVGRTDWNGRLPIGKTTDPLRLLYVKNGGAVLARLPTVPGLTKIEVADISGDDMRLQAEAYIRGVQNAIVDLVAIRELFKARIMMRLKNGEMEKAQELLEALRSQPTNEKLASDMGKKQDAFIKAIGRNANQRGKVDEMFKITRDLLSQHITPKLQSELELAMIEARNNGGRLPNKPDPEE